MKILWTVNTLMPEVANRIGVSSAHSISWIAAMSKEIIKSENVSLAIVCGGAVQNTEKHVLDGITYYIMPNDWNEKDYWEKVLEDYRPDILHLYGTENGHNYVVLKNYPQYPAVVSLQGILTEYYRHYYAGIDFSTMLKYTTIKDLFFPTGFFSGRNALKKRSKKERMILREARFVEGRTKWDMYSALNINPQLKYFYCPRLIRPPFYQKEWKIDNIERHSIFTTQGFSPEKGLHFLLEAVYKLSKKYPDVKLYISGIDRLHPKNLRRQLLPSGYDKYLRSLIRKYNLSDRVVFTGVLSAEEVANMMAKVHTTVLSSSIDNAPNALAEAMIVGTPTVASFVGGVMDMLSHNEDGFLYTYNEPNMLAGYISEIFESDTLSQTFSCNSRQKARQRHDPKVLSNKLLTIYEDIIKMY